MSEMCANIVSAVVFRFFFVFFVIPIGVVAATLGAIAGAVIGWSNKKWLVQNVITGAVTLTTLSYNLSKVTFDYLISDELGLAIIKLVKVINGCLRFKKAPYGKDILYLGPDSGAGLGTGRAKPRPMASNTWRQILDSCYIDRRKNMKKN